MSGVSPFLTEKTRRKTSSHDVDATDGEAGGQRGLSGRRTGVLRSRRGDVGRLMFSV